MRKYTLFLLFILSFLMVHAQNEPFPLYEGAIPNAKQAENLQKSDPRTPGRGWTEKISIPTMMRFDPADNLKNGTTVVICPGGGYAGVADEHEGTLVAKELNKWGITAFVLRYRMPTERTMIDPSLGPVQDAQQAIRMVRINASKWGLNPNRIGIMGFSAGGHLAATATTRFKMKADSSVTDTTSVRPDFSVLAYPVISMKEDITHGGSRNNLLGVNPSFKKVISFSNEEQITAQTPPVFLVHAADDKAVPVENSLNFYQNCVKKGVPAEMHLYPKGGHGFGMVNPTTKAVWMDNLSIWLDSLGFLKK
jgi:acetyl esterase/lipase